MRNGEWGPWEVKYAYFPRKICGEWVWLSHYLRRERRTSHVGGDFVDYLYSTLK